MKRKVQVKLQNSIWLIIILVIALHASSKVSGEVKHKDDPTQVELKLTKESGAIQLQWRGNRESELSHFTVEKSTDGKLFKELAVIMTSEEGWGGNLMTYLDRNRTGKTGKLFYRLRLNTINGTYYYSATQSIQY